MSGDRGKTKPQLDVYFDDQPIGKISTIDGVNIQFSYLTSWLEKENSFPISVSIPLVEGPVESEIGNNFFVNLLPEANIRKRTCEKLGISVGNNYELLRILGGECAGALLIIDEGKLPNEQNEYKEITEEQLAEWSKGDQFAFAEVAEDEEVRLSLAGAQDKLAVKIEDGKFYLPKRNSPSTHILKFASHAFRHLPENETFTTMLGKAAGVDTVDIALHQTAKKRIAVVTRYDRVEKRGRYSRIHQEDFCQALGAHPDQKYEKEDGPTLEQCIALVKKSCSVPAIELEKFIRWVLFNWLVHNADAHAKNISLLFVDGATKITPFYDLVCTRNYDRLNKRLAMSIGGADMPGAVSQNHLEIFAGELGVKPSYLNELALETIERLESGIDETVEEFIDLFGESAVLERISKIVRERCRRARTASLRR